MHRSTVLLWRQPHPVTVSRNTKSGIETGQREDKRGIDEPHRRHLKEFWIPSREN